VAVAGVGYPRQGLVSDSLSEGRESGCCRVTAGDAVEVGKPFLSEQGVRRAALPHFFHSRRALASRLEISHTQRLTGAKLQTPQDPYCIADRTSRTPTPRLHPRLRLLHHPLDAHYCTATAIPAIPPTARQSLRFCFVLIGHSRLLPRATPIPDKAKTSASFPSIYHSSPQAQIAPPVCVASSTVCRCET